MKLKRYIHGFTLIELMIVVAVVSLLASLAYSSYSEYVVRSRRAEAFAALEQMAGAMEKGYTINSFYLSNTGAAFVPPPTTIFTSTVPLDGGTPYYNLTVQSQANTTFTLQATPTGVQTGDGAIRLNNLGAKSWDQNADGDFDDPNEDNWKKD